MCGCRGWKLDSRGHAASKRHVTTATLQTPFDPRKAAGARRAVIAITRKAMYCVIPPRVLAHSERLCAIYRVDRIRERARCRVQRVHRRAGLGRAPRRRSASLSARRSTADSGGDGDPEPPEPRARGPPPRAWRSRVLMSVLPGASPPGSTGCRVRPAERVRLATPQDATSSPRAGPGHQLSRVGHEFSP